jgi:uncharacterized surface protein with fasciclin (FAS1) repeats
MSKHIIASVALAAAALLGGRTNVTAEDKKNVLDTAASAGQFKSLVAAVREAGLAETLKGKGPFTVFAPTDEAFKKIPEDTLKALLTDKEKLKKVLLAHVVVGKDVRAADVVKMNGAKLNGFTVNVAEDKVMIGKANVVKTDIACANGVIHEIDAVLIPD